MKAVLISLLVVSVIMFFIIKILTWTKSENSVKQSIGCTLMALLIGGFFILSLVGACKSCISDIENSSNDYDYYDAPRK